MGSKRLESIADLARWGVDLQVRCPCGHVALLRSEQVLREHCQQFRHGPLSGVVARMRCTKCKRRGPRYSTYLRD